MGYSTRYIHFNDGNTHRDVTGICVSMSQTAQDIMGNIMLGKRVSTLTLRRFNFNIFELNDDYPTLYARHALDPDGWFELELSEQTHQKLLNRSNSLHAN